MSTNTKMKTESVASYMLELGQKARESARFLARATTAQKNQALTAIANNLLSNTAVLIAENGKDLQAGKDKGLDMPCWTVLP